MSIQTLNNMGYGGFNRCAIVSSSTTWTHPDGASLTTPRPILVQICGGGGGGASGSAVANISTSNYGIPGGSGGGSGTVTETYAITTGTMTIAIGAGGTGGAAASSSGAANSNSGNPGGNTSITFSAPFGGLIAYGGRGGSTNSVTTSGNSYTQGANGGTAAPTWTLYSAGTSNTGVIGSNGLNSGTSGGNDDKANSFRGTTVGFGQGNAGEITYSYSANGEAHLPTDINFVKQSSLPAGSGAEGGHHQNGSTTLNIAGGTGGTGYFGNGGNGGTSNHVTTGNATATAGTTGSGYGGGGGGGGAASTRTANTATSGAGGNGAAGTVYIFY